MKYIKFEINKFKGINNLILDLSVLPNGKIFPLVGLNESGKTTILEAISFFQEDIKIDKRHEIIHKKDSANFSGDIRVLATLKLEDENKKNILEILTKNSFQLENPVESISVARIYSYTNASFVDSKFELNFDSDLMVSPLDQSDFKKLVDVNNTLFNEITEILKRNIPKILYFPNFLFDFPEKIYLENIDILPVSEKDKNTQKEYRQILDDILHCINNQYAILDFLTKLKALGDPAQQAAAAQIKSEISVHLKKEIVAPWHKIFPGPDKNILIETGYDTTGYFLQMKVSEGTSSFLINERSLGFRWFFGFILFTVFRRERVGELGEYVFLFDEPASNLHERSQQKLLDLFNELAERAKIIYSTHSPYLINKTSILNSFVVKDEGRSAEEAWDFRQDIKAVLYKNFVANNPNQEGHFKPILDVLEFVENPFIPTGKIIFTEGKFDYYTFKLIEEKFFKDQSFDFNFYPGGGVASYEDIFREYLANNRKFIAIFDADGDSNNGGIGAKKKYIDAISQELDKNIFVLSDIDIIFNNFQTEDLFTEAEKLEIQKKTFPSSTVYKKSEFNTAIQELFINKNTFEISNETVERFKKIFDFIKQKFIELN